MQEIWEVFEHPYSFLVHKTLRRWTAIHENTEPIMGQGISFQPSLYVLGDSKPLGWVFDARTRWIHTVMQG